MPASHHSTCPRAQVATSPPIEQFEQARYKYRKTVGLNQLHIEATGFPNSKFKFFLELKVYVMAQ